MVMKVEIEGDAFYRLRKEASGEGIPDWLRRDTSWIALFQNIGIIDNP
jgi:hypothetical protein